MQSVVGPSPFAKLRAQAQFELAVNLSNRLADAPSFD